MPLTLDHPEVMVTPETVDALAVGMVSAVAFDGQRLRADLLVWSPDAIHAIASGRRELSAGYEADYADTGNGLEQRKIRGNHLALVRVGRSGSAQRIGG